MLLHTFTTMHFWPCAVATLSLLLLISMLTVNASCVPENAIEMCKVITFILTRSIVHPSFCLIWTILKRFWYERQRIVVIIVGDGQLYVRYFFLFLRLSHVNASTVECDQKLCTRTVKVSLWIDVFFLYSSFHMCVKLVLAFPLSTLYHCFSFVLLFVSFVCVFACKSLWLS